ncbi:Histone chaperone ASF1 [Seminavis robusta]|uniref:Histone chaperone ASF1 n=1 Tax=Seminavis robusta TaxID=568900 RepID=A0A9N8HBK5_9STRA|nr:Histone chaperone ASF1 [Seminavis robusta]|eukprot:Sro264_g102600.1 Histone chaperone ASF1 (256) ;mRNA; r:55955-56964
MALVNVVNMVVLDNPTTFNNPFQFEITFECLQELEDDLEWKVLYVGSAHDTSKDQTLDEILVGPIPVGVNKFVLQADAPDPGQLPPDEIIGVTVVLVTCSYREKEFLRVGYYVNNEYLHPDGPPPVKMGEDGQPLPPPPPPKYPQLDLTHVQRQILADKPRVTKFAIPWTDEEAAKQAEQKKKDDEQAAANADPNDTTMALESPTKEAPGTPQGGTPQGGTPPLEEEESPMGKMMMASPGREATTTNETAAPMDM